MTSHFADLSRRGLLLASAAASTLSAAGRSAAAAAGVKRWRTYASCRYGQVHLTVAAPSGTASRPPLLCLHQSPASGDFFREFQDAMAVDRMVICPDTPGYGGSDKPAKPPTLPELGGAMIETIRTANVTGPMDVIGFHTGNYVAIEMALQEPKLIRKMVLPAIPYYAAADRPSKLEQFGKPRPLFTDPDFVGRNWRETVIARKTPGVSPERHMDLFTERMRAGTTSWYGFDAVFRYDADRALRGLTHPVLCPIINETLAEPTRIAARMIPNVKVVEAMDLDAWAWQAKPDRMRALVTPFLDT
jgi:pimeloyl-ACP methyl ester carboxylesterase